MEARKEKLSQLLENNRLLIGSHEPRSALIDKEYTNYKEKYFSGSDPFSHVLSIFGDNNLGISKDSNTFETYDEYRDHKRKKRKERKNFR